MQYEKSKNVSLISDPIPIKLFPYGTKVLHSLLATSIREGDCYDSWNFVASQFANGGSQIQGVDFDNSYIPVTRDESFIINIAIVAMHGFTASIFYVNNYFQNKMYPLIK